MADDEALSLRKMTFEGIPYDDDWLVIWRGLAVGRIFKQNGMGSPAWWWGANFDQRPPGSDGKGVGVDLDDRKRQFKVAWARVRARLSEEDIEAARRNNEEAVRWVQGAACRSRTDS